LASKYGQNIYLVNLVKSNEHQPREKKLADEYKNAINFINNYIEGEDKIQYIHLDLKKLMKRDMEEFIERTTRLAFYIIMKHGLFSLYTDTRISY